MLVAGVGLIVVAGSVLAANGSDPGSRVDGVARAQEVSDDLESSDHSVPNIGSPERSDADPEGVLRFRLTANHEGGAVYCGLFAEDSWPGLPVQFDIEPVEDDTVVCEFEDVESGEYAAAAFHDQNGNDNLDLNWLGLPEEEWTFSGNVRRLLPLPRFEDIKFEFSGGRETVDAALE